MAENRNDTVVGDFEAIMRPKARLSKGVVGMMQTSTMAMLEARRGHGTCKCYPELVRERGGECHIKTTYNCPVRVRVSFGLGFPLTTTPVTHDAAPETVMIEKMHMAGDAVMPC